MEHWLPEVARRVSIRNRTLWVDGNPISNDGLVDQVGKEVGGFATLFVRNDMGFIRISTNLKKSDGSRAVGTFLSADSPAAKHLTNGESYIGRMEILGSAYVGSYEPVFEGKTVAGVFFIGVRDLGQSLIKDYLRHQKLLKTGYFYILDSSGKLLLHPTKEGENVIDTADLSGEKIFKEIIDRKSGVLRYSWMNGESHLPQKKLALFRYFPELDWYVAASLNLDEAEEAAHHLRWILLGITFFMTLGMAFTAMVFGKRIAYRLESISGGVQMAATEVDRRAGARFHRAGPPDFI